VSRRERREAAALYYSSILNETCCLTRFQSRRLVAKPIIAKISVLDRPGRPDRVSEKNPCRDSRHGLPCCFHFSAA
jgi:hypothetical protein